MMGKRCDVKKPCGCEKKGVVGKKCGNEKGNCVRKRGVVRRGVGEVPLGRGRCSRRVASPGQATLRLLGSAAWAGKKVQPGAPSVGAGPFPGRFAVPGLGPRSGRGSPPVGGRVAGPGLPWWSGSLGGSQTALAFRGLPRPSTSRFERLLIRVVAGGGGTPRTGRQHLVQGRPMQAGHWLGACVGSGFASIDRRARSQIRAGDRSMRLRRGSHRPMPLGWC